MFVILWMGLVCVPEGGVGWDMQVYIAEKVGIIRNVMDDRRRVGRWGPWQWITLTNKLVHWLRALAQSEVWRIECLGGVE